MFLLGLVASVLASPPPEDAAFQSYLAHIYSATAALERGDTRATREWLAQAPDKHRGWEWTYLNSQTDISLDSWTGHEGAATVAVFSPDGQTVATTGSDMTVRLWTSKGTPLAVMKGHAGLVSGLRFSPDGKRLASTSRDMTVRLWDVESRKETAVLKGHTASPYNCAFSPDGKFLVTPTWRMGESGPIGHFKIWDVAAAKEVRSVDYQTHPLSFAEFNADGSKCYISCWDHEVAEFRTDTWEFVRKMMPETSETYKAVDWMAMSPDKTQIVTACRDNVARIFDVKSGEMRQVLTGAKNSVAAVAWSPDGQWIAGASRDQTIRVWDASSGALRGTLRGHTAPVRGLDFSPDGHRLASSSSDGTIRLWDARQFDQVEKRFKTGTYAYCSVPSPDGRLLAISTSEFAMQIWDVRRGRMVQELPKTHESYSVYARWSPDGKRIVDCGNDGRVVLYDVATNKVIRELIDSKGQIQRVSWSRDGRWIAAAHGDSALRVWDGEGALKHEIALGSTSYAVEFTDSGEHLACSLDTGSVILVDPKTGKTLKSMSDAPKSIRGMDISTDGRWLAVGGSDGRGEIWDLKAGRRIHKLLGMSDVVYGMSFSPDGRRLATMGYDFTARLWDVATGREVFAWRDLPENGLDIHFFPDGKRLAFTLNNGEVRVMDARPFNERN